MVDLVDDFLDEATRQLSDLESLLTILEKKTDLTECWDALYSFFDFVRSVAPFAGFFRSYRLSDAALREIRGYRENSQNDDVLQAVLAKFLRVRDILFAAGRLKREARESDDDLLPPVAENLSVFSSDKTRQTPVTDSDILTQEAELDKREEELILWAQALTEQENALKRKENILFKEENSQVVSQKKINQALNRLSEQERIQDDLEKRLESTRQELQNCQEKLTFWEGRQKQSERLLENKDAALNEMSLKIQDLNRILEEKKALNEQREEQLFRELEKNREQAAELQNNLELLEETHSEVNEDREKIFSKYNLLEKDYQDLLSRLNEETENKDRMLKEKRELEKQHLEFNTRIVVLQEKLGVEKEKVKHAELLLEQQKRRAEAVQSELRAAGWPYDTERVQKELAVLARQNEDKSVTDSLISLKNLISQIRTRSFVKISGFLKNMLQTTAQRYQRPYKLTMKNDVVGGMDKDALAVLEQMLIQLTDNAFRYAFPKDKNEPLLLNFQAQEDGVYLQCSFSDNGSAFDFDRLYDAVQTAGLTDEKVTLDRSELLAYLFHNAVKKDKTSNLIHAVQLLEKSGGQISVDFSDGLKVDFSIPKHFLFDKVLLFKLSGRLMAVPLNAVAETFFLKEDEIKTENGFNGPFFYWKGKALPVLKLDKTGQDGFGLVIQSGIFSFLLPVQQILDTEALISFSDPPDKGCSYLVPCTVLESGREPLWLDIAELMAQVTLSLPRKIVSLTENAETDEEPRSNLSYLVFKSDPDSFGAVRIDAVLRVEDFVLSASDSVRKKFLETQGEKLPLKDSCPCEYFPYAKAVLIFKTYALAIHEVVDIIDVPNADAQKENVDFIVYHGRKVPVLSAKL